MLPYTALGSAWLALLFTACGDGDTEVSGTGVDGVATGQGDGCTPTEAKYHARQDLDSKCFELSKQPCISPRIPDCKRAQLAECGGGGVHCTQQGVWSVPDTSPTPSQPPSKTPGPGAATCPAPFCDPTDDVCHFQVTCTGRYGTSRTCQDLQEQESTACRGDTPVVPDGTGDCPTGFCLPYDAYCDYTAGCYDGSRTWQTCYTDAEYLSTACDSVYRPDSEPLPPPEDDWSDSEASCDGYDWENHCAACDGNNENGDGCCTDDYESNYYYWDELCPVCDEDPYADACCWACYE